MKIGIGMFMVDGGARPDDIAAAVEERGFESLWVSEHSHIPQQAPPPFPGFDARLYSSMLDPFVALTAAAMVTRRIRLGTAITLVIQRDPINCAKSVASIDVLSGGRVLLGIGAGWNEHEMRNHGTDPDTRFRLMRERVEAMCALWTKDAPEYHGRMVNFDPVWQLPKPVQKPHPPILVAGSGPGVLKRVVSYADGWLPVVVPEVSGDMRGRVTPMAEFREWAPKLLRMAEAAGRPRPDITVTGSILDASTLAEFVDLGVTRVNLNVPPVDRDTALGLLDDHQRRVMELDSTLLET